MSYKTVFVTERAEVHQQAGLDVAPPQLDIIMLRNPDIDTLKLHLQDANYLISERRGLINNDLLDSSPNLKLILRLGSQTYDIDLNAAKSRNIAVAFAPQPSVIRVAEHSILQMLVLLKQIFRARKIAMQASDDWGTSRRTDEDTFSYNWSKLENVSGLYSKTIGILGFGEIGFELSRRLSTWNVSILYNKRSQLPSAVESDLNIHYTTTHDIFIHSDIVVNLLPYTPETDNFINAERIAKMKPTAFLVSTGSGSVIDEQAAANAIISGQIAGIALDTYEYEPLRPDNPLVQLAHENHNIFLTPHTAAGTMSNLDERRDHFSNILRHIHGEPLTNRLV